MKKSRLVVAAVSFALAGCGASNTQVVKKSNQLYPGCPDWAQGGSTGCPKPQICDVGVVSLASSGGDKQLAVRQSEEDGRTKLAARLKSNVAQRVSNATRATTQGGAGTVDKDEILGFLNQSKIDLTGSAAINHCMSDDGLVVSLMQLDPAAVKDLVKQMAQAQIPEEVKQNIRAEADKMYEELNTMK